MSEGRDSLHYRLQGSKEEVGAWGHEYVRYFYLLPPCFGCSCKVRCEDDFDRYVCTCIYNFYVQHELSGTASHNSCTVSWFRLVSVALTTEPE